MVYVELLQVAEVLQAVVSHLCDLVLLQVQSGKLSEIGEPHISDTREVIL